METYNVIDVHHGMPLINSGEMDVVILVGGEGTRLRKVLSDCPKPMAEINKRPFLDILIEHISSYGFKRFILCTGYRADFIHEYYSHANTSRKIIFSEETIPLGTGGAVKNAGKFIQSNPFLVMNGDSFCPVNMYEFVDFHIRMGAHLSMAVAESDNSKDFGLLALDSSQKIINFKEKIERMGKSYINAGIYLFDKEVLSMIPQHVKYSLEYDLFPKLVGGKFYGFITKENLMDIGTPERYEHAKKLFKNDKTNCPEAC